MSGVIARSASFTFAGFYAIVTDISVETPTAGVADMTGLTDGANARVLVPTRELNGGSVTVGFIQQAGGSDPQSLIGKWGPLRFSSTGYSVSRQAILESASTEARVGELIRGTLKFRMTDYRGSR
jgi:hypothetical protein